MKRCCAYTMEYCSALNKKKWEVLLFSTSWVNLGDVVLSEISESRSVMSDWTIESTKFSRPEYWSG